MLAFYRRRADQLRADIATLEGKVADARKKAAKERTDGQRARQSISRSPSASTVQSKLRDAVRHEERAAQHDGTAAGLLRQLAAKQSSLTTVEGNVERTSAGARRKQAADLARRRREELRHLQDLERRRSEAATYSTALPSSRLSGNPVYTPLLRSDLDRSDATKRYDVCLSFAGEQRDYVRRVSGALKALGVSAFYDEDEKIALWGTNLLEHFDRVYRIDSLYCVMFVSLAYAARPWGRLERRSALARAMLDDDEYVLPVRFDDTELPGLLPTTAYIDLKGIEPETLAEFIAEKVAARRADNLSEGQDESE